MECALSITREQGRIIVRDSWVGVMGVGEDVDEAIDGWATRFKQRTRSMSKRTYQEASLEKRKQEEMAGWYKEG